jgi:hypothetical protein
VRLYPDIPRARAAAILNDVVVLVLLVLLAWLGLKVHDSVAAVASVPRGVADAGSAIQNGFRTAGDAVADIPVAGGPLSGGLRDAGNASGGQIQETATAGEQDIKHLALVLGLVTFLIPAIALLALSVPDRVREARRLTAASRAIGPSLTPERERTLAERAAFGLPYERLVRYSPDPFGDLEAGRYDALVTAALDDAGIRPPRGG